MGRSRRDYRSVHCSGGCDCCDGTRVFSWECEHACLTPVIDSMLAEGGTIVKKSCYSGSNPQTRVFCAKGHPMTATSVLLTKHDNPIGLCGGLSYQKSRIMPYSIIPCKGHASVNLDDRESNLDWECTGCFLANAHGEPLCCLELALNYRKKFVHRAGALDLDSFLSNPKNAAKLPDGPLLRHLRFGATLDKRGDLAKYSQRWPEVDTMMQLMAEFAHRLFYDKVPDDDGRSYPAYCGGSSRAALADAISALGTAKVPGFAPLKGFRFFRPAEFHTNPWYDQDLWEPKPWARPGCSVGQRRCRYCGNPEREKKRFLAGGGRKGDLAADRMEAMSDFWDEE